MPPLLCYFSKDTWTKVSYGLDYHVYSHQAKVAIDAQKSPAPLTRSAAKEQTKDSFFRAQGAKNKTTVLQNLGLIFKIIIKKSLKRNALLYFSHNHGR
jgi:hypothetical protein